MLVFPSISSFLLPLQYCITKYALGCKMWLMLFWEKKPSSSGFTKVLRGISHMVVRVAEMAGRQSWNLDLHYTNPSDMSSVHGTGNHIAKCTGHAITGWLAFPFLEESKLILLTFWQSYFLNFLVLLLFLPTTEGLTSGSSWAAEWNGSNHRRWKTFGWGETETWQYAIARHTSCGTQRFCSYSTESRNPWNGNR